MKPLKIRRTGTAEIAIEWEDGHDGRHSLRSLRKYCPCASCKTEVEASEGMVMLPILSPGQCELQSIEPVGAYAVQLAWGDGHRTGIYTYDYLRQICECEECRKVTAE